MKGGSLLPKGENLRRAVRWISDQGDHTYAAVEDACRRFDLSPSDEEFLLKHLVTKTPQRGNEEGGSKTE